MKSTKYITLFSTTVVAGLLLSVTACSADENTTPPAESSESVASFDEYTHLAGDLTNEALHTEADTNEEHALITECMADAGYEYFPVEQEELMNTPDDSETPPFGTLEYAQEFGYEISIQNTQQTFPEDMDFDEYLYTYTSENQDYIASLSDAERQAYNDALFGSSDDEGLYEEGCKDLFEKLKKQKQQVG